MKRALALLALTAVLIGSALFGSSFLGRNNPQLATVRIERGPLSVISNHPGKLEARNVVSILSHFNGSATVIELIPEGQTVEPGDLLVRFDASAVEREITTLERDRAVAQAELESLKKAELPLELAELEARLAEVTFEHEREQKYLDESILLQADGLVSEPEIARQRALVTQLNRKHAQLNQARELTATWLHPSRIARARAKRDSADQALQRARQQLQNCSIYAPASGVVVYKPLHIGGEFRTVRVGDPIYQNQPFIVIPDMSELLVHLDVPETELARTTEGLPVTIHPLAYPNLTLPGRVESIARIARARSGRPAWQRWFHTVVAITKADPRMRSGMSIQARILHLHRDNALLIPRASVSFDGDQAWCQLLTPAGPQRRNITIGHGNESAFEVLHGLDHGDEVLQ